MAPASPRRMAGWQPIAWSAARSAGATSVVSTRTAGSGRDGLRSAGSARACARGTLVLVLVPTGRSSVEPGTGAAATGAGRDKGATGPGTGAAGGCGIRGWPPGKKPWITPNRPPSESVEFARPAIGCITRPQTVGNRIVTRSGPPRVRVGARSASPLGMSRRACDQTLLILYGSLASAFSYAALTLSMTVATPLLIPDLCSWNEASFLPIGCAKSITHALPLVGSSGWISIKTLEPMYTVSASSTQCQIFWRSFHSF